MFATVSFEALDALYVITGTNGTSFVLVSQLYVYNFGCNFPPLTSTITFQNEMQNTLSK